jgi:hypothetical protein
MKKSLITLTIMLAAAAMIAAFSCPVQAAVTGPCANCHTMHNSQGGANMAVDETNTLTTTAYAHLTMSSCVGCHFKATSIPAPKIDGTYNDDSTAGGTFLESGAAGEFVASDAGVHNVLEGLATSTLGEDNTFVGAGDIPGLTGSMNHTYGSTDPNDLTCAGSNGCHGQASVAGNDAGIKGFHHGSVSGWRYLQIANGGAAVVGVGAADWEKAMSDGWNTGDEHNVYSSSTSVGINKLCANCHPNFHGTANTQDVNSDWIRHPTDNDIPAAWSAVVDYRDNPFAFADPIGSSMLSTGTYTATNAQVACISCHRAHGTPYDDILRWDYSTQVAGGGYVAGCLGCHTLQD